MNRRKFLYDTAIISSGSLFSGMPEFAGFNSDFFKAGPLSGDLFQLFSKPDLYYHPFVRWWWNGNKVESRELVRELRLLKEAGIGGVEINPVEFPSRFEGDDLGCKSLEWLSDEWIDMLRVVFNEAKSLGMTCDLIVGSGWPFGAEYLEGEERAQILVKAIKRLSGPVHYEISRYEIFREADPPVSSPFPGRTMELISLVLVPDPLIKYDQIINLNSLILNESFRIDVPSGKFALTAVVKINGFMQVINGVLGATGPVLNHYNKAAIEKYLNRMSEAIEKRIGPLSGNIRALFTDSMELEGSNWSSDLLEQFVKRRGYDLKPFLPLILFRTGVMGNVTDYNYGVTMSAEIEDMVCRIRYDFELTKAELLEERFVKTFSGWCKKLGVKSRAQAYGRNFFPLESSFFYDIPESESWTMNWLKHKIGEEMPEDDYRRGRAYTMINKYVSSAANLTGKRLVSCEEMTDTYMVFNTSLENLKIGGDQSAITGVSHSVFHGFNYSPPEAPYPGWIRYGCYYNENNTWWPYFHLYNEYKGRLSTVFQNSTMYSDIAILPPNDDMWSTIGAQNEPFPSITNVDYFTLVWEAINKNGNGCDYISQRIIIDSVMKNGFMIYGPRKYSSIFLVQIESLHPETSAKLYEFISSGGRVFCIETYPSKSLGWHFSTTRNSEVKAMIEKMKLLPDRFILLKKPEKDYLGWFKNIQKKYGIAPYLEIKNPDPYLLQIRYHADNGSEIFYLVHSNINNSLKVRVLFPKEVIKGKNCWLWNPADGKRFRVNLDNESGIDLDVGPADSFLFVLDSKRHGQVWNPLPADGINMETMANRWKVEFIHCHEGAVKTLYMDNLTDIKEMPGMMNFAGTIIYHSTITVSDRYREYLNLGKVHGVSELCINNKVCGIKWYGRRIYRIKDYLVKGENAVKIKITTSMGNYMKSLKDNPIAQYWTNEKNKIQPLQPVGLIGPVTLY